MNAAQFAAVAETGRHMLQYVAVYSIFDAVAITYCGSLKGAGDIRFVMWMLVFCSLGCLILPTIVILTYYPSLGWRGLWICLTMYIFVLGAVTHFRFRGGKWKKMSVIGR